MSSSSLHLISSDDEINMRKLECLKTLRDVTLELHEKKSLLHNVMRAMDEEAKCLDTFRQEKDLIEQEKLAHAEELRLIHSDLHQMESIIQESETESDHHLTLAKSLLVEWQQLADRANKMRFALGLDKLPDLPEENKLRNEIINSSGHDDGFSRVNQMDLPGGFSPLLMVSKQHMNQRQLLMFPPSMTSSSRDFEPSHLPHSFGLSSMMNPRNGPSSSNISSESQSSSANERSQHRPAFYQQPPPMKSCLTCLQQIHRNAPICPNCKAKSRSRNPKKPKRKPED